MNKITSRFVKAFKFIVVVACYALVVAFTNTSVRADENAPTTTPAPTTEPTLAPLMSALDKIGLA